MYSYRTFFQMFFIIYTDHVVMVKIYIGIASDYFMLFVCCYIKHILSKVVINLTEFFSILKWIIGIHSKNTRKF